jgi:Na+-driven multidrug efflux pump
MYCRAATLLLWAWAPVVVLGCCFAESILRMWVGPEVAEHGSTVLRVLLISALVDVATIVSSQVLGARGEVRVLAMVKAAWLPVYAVALVALARGWGVAGVAFAAATGRLVYAVVFSALAIKTGVALENVVMVWRRAALWSVVSAGVWLGGVIGGAWALSALLGSLALWAIAFLRWASQDEEFRQLARALFSPNPQITQAAKR